MKTLRVLYHMARADFLERTRRYSFLLALGVVIWLGYAAATGIITLTVSPNYTGKINSGYVCGRPAVNGCLYKWTCTLLSRRGKFRESAGR